MEKTAEQILAESAERSLQRDIVGENEIMAKTHEYFMEAFGYEKRPIQNPKTLKLLGRDL